MSGDPNLATAVPMGPLDFAALTGAGGRPDARRGRRLPVVCEMRGQAGGRTRVPRLAYHDRECVER